MEAEAHQKKTGKPEGPKKNRSYLIAAVVIVLVIAVAYVAVSATSTPVVAAGDTINVSYTGSFTNGTVFGSNVGGQPLQFTVGAGQLIKGFDQGVIGMHVGQERNITVPVNEAYGPVNPSLIIQIPSNSFGNQTANVGMQISTEIGGQQAQGVVTVVNGTTVTANFNPPLAGKTLDFQIKVLAIKEG